MISETKNLKHEKFMKKAMKEAEYALQKGEFPVGCIIEYDDEVLVSGSRRGTVKKNISEIDHAEMVALKKFENLKPVPSNPDKSKMTLYCNLEPCLMCFGAILLSGIGKIVYAYEDTMGGGTNCNRADLKPLYKNNNISIIPHIMRNESLLIFKTYFSDPDNSYWKGSLLASYTLEQ